MLDLHHFMDVVTGAREDSEEHARRDVSMAAAALVLDIMTTYPDSGRFMMDVATMRSLALRAREEQEE